jgi:hypothetical protein
MNDHLDAAPDFPPLAETHPHLMEFMDFLPALNEESDRGAALIATSFIDELLRRTIRSFLVECPATDLPLSGFNAPLGTFSARAAAVTALGLLHEAEARDIDRLRKVRNRFAHQVHASFADQSVSDICAQLELAAQDYSDVKVAARGRFVTSATAVILNLTNRPHYVGLERLIVRSWRI